MKHANDNTRQAIVTNSEPLRFLSVCSGIEAASVAWPQWQAVAFSEIEKFPSAVLAHHYPDVPNLGDFTKIDTTTLGSVDILCGGTPCQAFSVAGLRGGLNDERGNLTLKFVELAHALAAGNGLRNVVWENVVGVLSDKGNAFGCFLGGLVGADAAVVPSDKPADGKSSKHWKWRKGGRWPVLDDDGEPTGEYVTQEPWHALTWPNAGMVAGPKGRAAWRVCDAQYWGVAQRRRRVIVVADFGNGADPSQVLFECEGLQRDIAPSREKGEGASADVAPSLVSSGRGVERTGDTRGQDPVVACYAPEIARCDATREGSSQDYETTTMVAQTVAISGREGGATAELGGEVATALRASQGGGDKPHVLAAVAVDCYNGSIDGDTTLTMRKGNGNALGGVPAALIQSAVRRLTPVECERLQGFPDDWTKIPWCGKPAEDCPDGPRYKALGNSWAVPLFAWLGRRIDKHMPPLAAINNNKDTTIADAA